MFVCITVYHVSHGCVATGKGTAEKILRFQGRNGTPNLSCNMLIKNHVVQAAVLEQHFV